MSLKPSSTFLNEDGSNWEPTVIALPHSAFFAARAILSSATSFGRILFEIMLHSRGLWSFSQGLFSLEDGMKKIV